MRNRLSCWQRKKKAETFTNRRGERKKGGREEEGSWGERGKLKDGEEERDHLDSCVCKCVDRISQDGGESVGEETNMVM